MTFLLYNYNVPVQYYVSIFMSLLCNVITMSQQYVSCLALLIVRPKIDNNIQDMKAQHKTATITKTTGQQQQGNKSLQ
jgi:hypothetical protein